MKRRILLKAGLAATALAPFCDMVPAAATARIGVLRNLASEIDWATHGLPQPLLCFNPSDELVTTEDVVRNALRPATP